MWLIESLLRARGRAARPGPLSVVGVMARRGHQSPPVTAPEPRHRADSRACSLQRCVDRLVLRRVSTIQWWRQAQGPDRAILRSELRSPSGGLTRCGGHAQSLLMSFLRSAYLAGGRTPHRPSSQVRRSLAHCLRSSLLLRAHPSRRPLPSEPRHHRSSRRAARFARAARPQPARHLGRSTPGWRRAAPGHPGLVGSVAGWWRGTRGSPARGAWCARRRQSAAAAGSRPPSRPIA